MAMSREEWIKYWVNTFKLHRPAVYYESILPEVAKSANLNLEKKDIENFVMETRKKIPDLEIKTLADLKGEEKKTEGLIDLKGNVIEQKQMLVAKLSTLENEYKQMLALNKKIEEILPAMEAKQDQIEEMIDDLDEKAI